MKLFLSRTIDGLEKSFVPNEELSTKLVYMMDQSEHSEDDFETEYDSHEEISMEEEDRTTNKSYQWQSVDVTKKHQEVFESELPDVAFLVSQMEMLLQQALRWQDQPAKHTQNKGSKIVPCFLVFGVEN